jgi:hypothetical protein
MAFFVQGLPDPRGQLAEKLGSSLGQGLAKRMGLAEAEKAASSAQGDPVKLAFSLARASTYAPELQRSLGTIYEQLLQRSQQQEVNKGLGLATGPGSGANPDITGEVSPKGGIAPSTDVPSNNSTNREIANTKKLPPKIAKDTQDVIDIADKFIEELRPDLLVGSSNFAQIPSYNFETKSDITPEEEANIRQQLSNYSPQAQERIIQRIREGTKAKWNETQQEYANRGVEYQRNDQRWKDFEAQSATRLPGWIQGFGPRTQEDLTNKYFQYAGNLPNNLSPEDMHARAMVNLKKDINRFNALEEIPAVPWFRNDESAKEYLDNTKDAYKPLLDEGYYEALKEDAVNNKDLGLEELHYVLYGDTTDKDSLNKIAALKAPKQFLGPVPGTQGMVEKRNKNYDKERKSYISSLSSNLKTIKPKDDLILLRSQVLGQGGTEKDFNEALDMAIDKGLKLSAFQESQLQEVRIPRQRPVWEILNPKAWSNMINLFRGKK